MFSCKFAAYFQNTFSIEIEEDKTQMLDKFIL